MKKFRLNDEVPLIMNIKLNDSDKKFNKPNVFIKIIKAFVSGAALAAELEAKSYYVASRALRKQS